MEYNMKMKLIGVLLSLLFIASLSCEDGKKKTTDKSVDGSAEHVSYANQFKIISGSENKTLEPLINEFERKHDVDVIMKYKGSVDIMRKLKKGKAIEYDAVWPANSLWIALGDEKRVVKHTKSIMKSPVAFGIKKSLAEKLGFVGKKVTVDDILKAIRNKKLKFTMTSATQSNSGASAYIGFLYALLGNPDMITIDDLHKEELKKKIKELLSGINRSSGSSGWLKDMFLKGDYDAMVNYEAVLIETNKELIARGREPLYLVYPVDGLVIADSPLGYVNKGNEEKEKLFKALQDYLLSKEVQNKIVEHGRRIGFGSTMENVDKAIFNPEWGIDTTKVLSPIKMPPANVLKEALNLYQTEFKKPSYTVFCLDYSGSMLNRGEKALKKAMELILDQNVAKDYLIHASAEDVTEVIVFSSKILKEWKVKGNSGSELSKLLREVKNFRPRGGTDIFSPVIEAFSSLEKISSDKYNPAVILMTDGVSNVGKKYNDLETVWNNMKKDIPVFPIMFGTAVKRQLKPIAEMTNGRLFDGTKNLVEAFRKAKGYN